MNLRDLWNREGAGKPAPSTGVAGYFYKIGAFFWRFVSLNWLFLLASLPIVTMPAALAAMDRVCIKLIRDRNVLLWAEFRDEFKASFKKSLIMGLFFALWLAAAYYLASLGVTNWQNPFGVVFIAMAALLCTAALLWGSYSFVLLASLDLRVRDLLHNARALLFMDRKWALSVFGVLFLVVTVTVLFFPYTLLFPLTVGVALTQYTICWFVNEPMERHIIRPYERQADVRASDDRPAEPEK